jgi:cytochrome c oxidase cbb3-type subunit 3
MAEFDVTKEGHNKPPIGWTVFFVVIIIWAVAYIAYYTPEISGWSHNKKFDEKMRASRQAEQAALANPYVGSEQAADEGEEMYEDNCAACHGNHMKNPAVGVDLLGALKYGDSDVALFQSVSKGRPNGMPSFGSQLGDDRIWKIVTYVASERSGK